MKASPYSELASQLEMTKALTYLKQRDIPRVSLVSLVPRLYHVVK